MRNQFGFQQKHPETTPNATFLDGDFIGFFTSWAWVIVATVGDSKEDPSSNRINRVVKL